MSRIKKFVTAKPHRTPLIIIGAAAVVLSIGLALVLAQKRAYVATGNIYLMPVSSAVQKGAEVRTVVRITPGTRVDTVTASVRFDTDSLSYKKTEYTNSPFPTQIPAMTKDGTVTVQSAKLGGETISADALVATLVFSAKKDSARTPELVYGNAAHAGTATNPTIAGRPVDEAANPLKEPAPTATAAQAGGAATAAGDGVATLVAPISTLLKKVGVGDETAERVALWLGGFILCCLLGAAGFASWLLYTRQKRKKNTPQEVLP